MSWVECDALGPLVYLVPCGLLTPSGVCSELGTHSDVPTSQAKLAARAAKDEDGKRVSNIAPRTYNTTTFPN